MNSEKYQLIFAQLNGATVEMPNDQPRTTIYGAQFKSWQIQDGYFLGECKGDTDVTIAIPLSNIGSIKLVTLPSKKVAK